MIRKTVDYTAILAAIALTVLAGAESSGANAQVAARATQTTATEAQLTDERVPTGGMPVFVEKEVVQAVPEAVGGEHASNDGSVPQAENLRELVAAIPARTELSDELRCLAGAIYFELRGEPLAGQLAVAQVIVNRAEDRRFPSSYCGVVYQRSQFSFVRGGRMPRIKTGSPAWKRARAIAQIAHRGLWESEVGEALYFHANYVRPSWTRKKIATATIQTHVFYK